MTGSVAATVTSFLFWVLLGSLTGLLYERSLLGRAASVSRAA